MVNILDEDAFGLWSKIVNHVFNTLFVRIDEKQHWKLLAESLKDGKRVNAYEDFRLGKTREEQNKADPARLCACAQIHLDLRVEGAMQNS